MHFKRAVCYWKIGMLRITDLCKKIPFLQLSLFFPKGNTTFYMHVKSILTGRKILLTSCMMLNAIACSFFDSSLYVSHSLKSFLVLIK